jgi:hypothetical protein
MKIWTKEGQKDDDFGLGDECQVPVEGGLIRVVKRRICVPFTVAGAYDPQIVPVGVSDEDWLRSEYDGKTWCSGGSFYDQVVAQVSVDGVTKLLHEAPPDVGRRIFFGRLVRYGELPSGTLVPTGIFGARTLQGDVACVVDGNSVRERSDFGYLYLSDDDIYIERRAG